ncbi:MAG: calcium-binding protein [Thermoguttaceae bacterium]|jgi:hypothetical protein
MLLATVADAHRNDIGVVPESCPKLNQRDRIIEALGPLGEHSPGVAEETLSKYHKYLTARLSFPFTAYYPEPMSTLEEVWHRCAVVELLDPTKHLGDEFSGIFCKTCKGRYEVNLPLTELEISQDSPNIQLIEDYWFWFWNWR